MRLSIRTPLVVVVDETDVTYVRAEDETGAFGIMEGHADFLTTLAVCVVMWRRGGEQTTQVAVRGGILRVCSGNHVSIATREAVGEHSLASLGRAVLERMRQQVESEEASHLVGTRMELATIRQIEQYVASSRNQLVGASGARGTLSLAQRKPLQGDQ
jgi:F-type H+-transporting ATPase subunit epsilon